MRQAFLEAGKIVGTHGVRGELRVESWSDSPRFLTQFSVFYNKEGQPVYEVESSRPHKSLLLLKLRGVDSIEQGDMLRGRVLYFRREDAKLPEGRYFIVDLLGLSVVDADTGQQYGELTQVYQTGANDVYEITAPTGKKYLIPVIDSVVLDTDLDSAILTIRPIPGIFEE